MIPNNPILCVLDWWKRDADDLSPAKEEAKDYRDEMVEVETISLARLDEAMRSPS